MSAGCLPDLWTTPDGRPGSCLDWEQHRYHQLGRARPGARTAMARHSAQQWRHEARPQRQSSQRQPSKRQPRQHQDGRGLLWAASVLFVLVLVLLAGWLHSSGRWPFAPEAGPPPVMNTLPPELGSPVVAVGSGTALAVLETLDVKGKSPRSDYKRTAFGEAWLDADVNSCDTRNDILRRDLAAATFTAGSLCEVAAGTLAEPYTGNSVAFKRGKETSGAVQIDHVVALGNAWQTGAAALTAMQRQSLANDPLNLLAVDGPANQEKSASDAASWLPSSKKFRCQYVARQISVKAAYQLWVSPAEKTAMKNVLGHCPEQTALASGYLQ